MDSGSIVFATSPGGEPDFNDDDPIGSVSSTLMVLSNDGGSCFMVLVNTEDDGPEVTKERDDSNQKDPKSLL
jgi:hypothetical protein